MSSASTPVADQPARIPPLRGDIAIIGMSALFPGAPNLAVYWQNIVSKVDAISDVPPEAWDEQIFYDPQSTETHRVYCKRGGYLGPIARFNPLAHGIVPLAVEGGEPDQWLALQLAEDALLDAGYAERIDVRQRTAVIIGKGTYINRGNMSLLQHGLMVEQVIQVLRPLHPELTEQDFEAVRAELKRSLPPLNTDTASALVPNIIAGRIANRLDLMGPSYTVDGACASSLLAIEIAVRDLLTGQCDLALVGGAQVTTPIPILTLFCQLNALSHREQMRAFDAGADGTILGEGIGMVVLKRREDAERDGDRIYAVIKGVGSSSDGRAMSVMAPRLEGEMLALQRAYTMAGVDPRTVELIEAHGYTGRRRHGDTGLDGGLRLSERTLPAHGHRHRQIDDRPLHAGRGYRRPDQGNAGAVPQDVAADTECRDAQSKAGARADSVLPQYRDAPVDSRRSHYPAAGRRQRLRLRRHQRPCRAGRAPGHGRCAGTKLPSTVG